jgi:hypothetical protein
VRYAAKSIHNPFDYTASSARAAMHAWDSSAVLATSTWVGAGASAGCPAQQQSALGVRHPTGSSKQGV